MPSKWSARIFQRKFPHLLHSGVHKERGDTECEQGRVELFKHKPLQHPWQIRLLELLPRDKPDSVRGKIRLIPGGDAKQIDPNYDVKQDADKVAYYALSYTWGDSKVKQEIQLDDKTFFVTANLYAFLWQWTPDRDKPSFFIWIDAISIDQENIKERNEQVKRMTSIYENAATGLIWLGPEAENSNLAMRGLSILATKGYTPGETSTGDAAIFRLNKDISLDEEFVLAIKHLLERPWWTRVWVIQEATVPEQSYLVLCGSMTIQWSFLHTALRSFRELTLVIPELGKLRSLIFRYSRPDLFLWKIRNARQSTPNSTKLFSLVCTGRRCEASNQRDHVYAFLGMTGSESTTSFNPDYEKSVNEVYQDFTQYMISTQSYGHNLDILGQAGSSSVGGGELRVDFRKLLDVTDQLNSVLQKRIDGNITESDADGEHILNLMFNEVRPLLIQACENPQFDALMREILPPPMYSFLRVFMGFDSAHSFQRFLSSHLEQISILEEDVVNWMEMSQQLITPIKSGPTSILKFANTLETSSCTIADKIVTCFSSETLDTSLTLQRQSQEKLPSWVPIWNKPLATIPVHKHFGNLLDGENFVYNASGRDPQPFLLGPSSLFNFNGHELHLRGFRVDVIKKLTSLIFTAGDWHSQHDEEAIWAKIQDTVDLNIEIYEGTNETMVDALRRTVMADIVFEEYEPIRRLKRAKQHQDKDYADNTTAPNWSRDACNGRSLATTAAKLIGLVPRLAQVDDEIFVLAGGQVLYVLRPIGKCFQYIGESYIHGLMDGEALQKLEDGTAEVDIIRII